MIGLDTGHLVYNYGTKFQAYAMQCLLEQNGEKCEIIQWYNKNYGALNGLADQVKKIKKVYSCYGLKLNYWGKALERYKAFNSFNSKFNIKKYYGTFSDMQENVKKYRTVFCGSDQAWLPDNVNQKRYTLDFCGKEIFKAAYAPSFGIDSIEEKHHKRYIEFLSNIDLISVREISGQKIIKDLINRDVPVVLDPTLLLTKKTWDDLMQESDFKLPTNEKYIFCYLLGENEKHRQAVMQAKKELGYKIINLQHFSNYCNADENFADYNLFDVTPQDFIYLLSKAEIVCTDSFHCTAFSIHYRKTFSVFHRFKSSDSFSTNTRLSSLLAQLNLEDRIIHDDKVNLDKIDYNTVYEKLENLRIISIEFMQKALEGNKNV